MKFLVCFLGESNFELGVPSGMKSANLVSVTKSATESHKNLKTQIVAANFQKDIGSVEVSEEKLWGSFGFFDASWPDYNMEKVNFPENTLLYVNQAYLTVQKKKKKIHHCDYYIRPKYNIETGGFLGLYETIGFTVIRGDAEVVFFKYGFDKENSKVLYSHYRRRTPNAFCGTMFNHVHRHRVAVESGELESDRSCLFFFVHL